MTLLDSPESNRPQTDSLTRVHPFLKWAGGKAKLVPEISRYVPRNYEKYLEPFLGGGAFFFSLCPNISILSDSNEELMNCYEVVRDDLESLHSALNEIAELPHNEETYYEVRRSKPTQNQKAKRAARMIYLNRTAFNGLYRVNRKGDFNTPFGRYKKLSLPGENVLLCASQALQNVELITCDFEETLGRAHDGDFVYLDPPYPAVGKYSDFNRYTKQFFSEKDHDRLSKRVEKLDEMGCTFVLSNADHPLIRELYDDRKYKIVRVFAPRYINCKGDQRGNVAEVLITNNFAGK